VRFEDFVSKLEHVKPCAGGVTARCPSHNDRQNSLSVSRGDDRILINCFAGCAPERVCAGAGLELRDLYYEPRNTGGGNGDRPRGQVGLTLAQFAAAKGLAVEFLAAQGVHEDKSALIFRYLLMSGQKAQRQRIRLSLNGEKRFIWNRSEGKPTAYGLWKIEEWRKAGVHDLILCEGESDSLTFWFYGLAALGVPGADLCSVLRAPHVAGFRRVLICKENDQGGETFEKGMTARVGEIDFDGQIAIVEMGKANVKDANELHLRTCGDPGGFEAEWSELVAAARPADAPRMGLEIVVASDVKTKPVEWIWPGRIPRGKLSILAGDPGLGKSFVTLDLAARLSAGAAWPDHCPNTIEPASTIIFSAEDAADDTIVPRLMKLGANLDRVYITRLTRKLVKDTVVERGFDLTTDLLDLEAKLKRYPDVRLVIIDPLAAYLGGTDSHKNAEMRGLVLEPLSRLAATYNVAVVCVSHLNKSGGDALYRISGSIGITGAARSVWVFAADPQNESRTLMLLRKINVGKRLSGLAFSLVEDLDGQATIAWYDEEIERDADEVMREREQIAKGGERLDKACALIREVLSDGEHHLSTELTDRCKELGISEATFRRARTMLGVKSHKTGSHTNVKWWISLNNANA